MTFRIATRGVVNESAEVGVPAAVADLLGDLEGPPDFLLVATSSAYELETVYAATRRAGTSRVHGLTSCLGSMTDRGVQSQEGKGLALLGIRDPGGAYGSAIADFDGDPHAAGCSAVTQALGFAGRPGEVPRLILMSATPGREEEVIAGIQSVVGPHVPILGGSAADNTVSGDWSIWTADRDSGEGVVVSALFPSVEVSFSFKSGYEPSGRQGVATRAEGRRLAELDGEPAAEVYDAWLDGGLEEFLGRGGNVLGRTALQPLGRPVTTSEGLTYYRLAHPDAVTEANELLLFAEVEEGETILSMSGSVDSLVARGGQVVERALRRARLTPEDASGAIVTYCGGCMLALGDRVPEMADRIVDAIPGVPFIGCFTFGEQGKFAGAANLHSNLMISAIVFGR